MSQIKIQKSRDTVSYARKLKAASSTATRHTIRAQKKRDWESYSRNVGFPKNRTVNNSNLLTLNSNCHNEKQQI